ncbi:MAG: hypothetical protein C0404_07715 [Verrucomicrobia bacterium]|nr:hypothetical protein [Verrucomicrobiota bacterium]
MNRRRLAVLLAFGVTFANTAPAAPLFDEYTLLRSMPADQLGFFRDRRPNAAGLFGKNIPTFIYSADQRGAMDLLTAGLGLTNDVDVSDGWRALEKTFTYQTTAGDFNDIPASVVFWMAWANHAVWVLLNSPYADRPSPVVNPAGGYFTYRERWLALRPQFERSMNYLLTAENRAILFTADDDSPNRSLINACAYAFGALLLDSYSPAATVTAARAEAQVYVNNEFTNDKLHRSVDGVFREKGGYDTSYQAVALVFFLYYWNQFPAQAFPAGMNQRERAWLAGRWLEERVPGSNVLDCTYDTRTGPNNANGEPKDVDVYLLKRALLYFGAMFRRQAAWDAAARFDMGFVSTNGLPPALFSEREIVAFAGVPITNAFLASNFRLAPAYATNVPVPPTPAVSMTIGGLPAGLTLYSLETNSSTGRRRFAGRVASAGVYPLTVIMSNSVYGSTTSTVNLRVVAPVEATFNDWQSLRYSPAERAFGMADAAATCAGSGIPNMIAYGLSQESGSATPSAVEPQLSVASGMASYLFFRGRSAATYRVLYSPDLSTWSDLAVNPGSAGADVTVPLPVSSRGFVRLRVEQ